MILQFSVIQSAMIFQSLHLAKKQVELETVQFVFACCLRNSLNYTVQFDEMLNKCAMSDWMNELQVRAHYNECK